MQHLLLATRLQQLNLKVRLSSGTVLVKRVHGMKTQVPILFIVQMVRFQNKKHPRKPLVHKGFRGYKIQYDIARRIRMVCNVVLKWHKKL